MAKLPVIPSYAIFVGEHSCNHRRRWACRRSLIGWRPNNSSRWLRQDLERGSTKLHKNLFVAHKITQNNTWTNTSGEATAQSRCQTLCSSKGNWKIDCRKARGHVSRCPIAGNDSGVNTARRLAVLTVALCLEWSTYSAVSHDNSAVSTATWISRRWISLLRLRWRMKEATLHSARWWIGWRRPLFLCSTEL